MLARAVSLLLIQMMDQINPAAWQWLVRNVVVIETKRLAKTPQYRVLVLSHLHTPAGWVCTPQSIGNLIGRVAIPATIAACIKSRTVSRTCTDTPCSQKCTQPHVGARRGDCSRAGEQCTIAYVSHDASTARAMPPGWRTPRSQYREMTRAGWPRLQPDARCRGRTASAPDARLRISIGRLGHPAGRDGRGRDCAHSRNRGSPGDRLYRHSASRKTEWMGCRRRGSCSLPGAFHYICVITRDRGFAASPQQPFLSQTVQSVRHYGCMCAIPAAGLWPRRPKNRALDRTVTLMSRGGLRTPAQAACCCEPHKRSTALRMSLGSAGFCSNGTWVQSARGTL